MTSTQKIVAEFKALFDDNETEIALAEMKVMLTDIYKASSSGKKKITKKEKSAIASDKPKREPTAYNLFMKEQMEVLKTAGSFLSGKEKMQTIAELWKAKKTSSSSDEETPVVEEETPVVEEAKVVVKKEKKSKKVEKQTTEC